MLSGRRNERLDRVNTSKAQLCLEATLITFALLECFPQISLNSSLNQMNGKLILNSTSCYPAILLIDEAWWCKNFRNFMAQNYTRGNCKIDSFFNFKISVVSSCHYNTKTSYANMFSNGTKWHHWWKFIKFLNHVKRNS